MNNLFGCLVILSVTIIAIIGIVAIFCYKQDNIKMILENKTTLKNGALSSDFKVDIDKNNKKDNSR